MTSPFVYVNSITHEKTNLMRDSANDDMAESSYVPFVVNRTLSYHQDTILLANLVNRYHTTDKKLQYEFLLHSVRKRKRFAKWTKAEADERIDLIQRAFQYSRRRAAEVVDFFTNEQIDDLRTRQYRGGTDDDK